MNVLKYLYTIFLFLSWKIRDNHNIRQKVFDLQITRSIILDNSKRFHVYAWKSLHICFWYYSKKFIINKCILYVYKFVSISYFFWYEILFVLNLVFIKYTSDVDKNCSYTFQNISSSAFKNIWNEIMIKREKLKCINLIDNT